ncbi:diguanylate cyclase [Massilia sp. X63]|uniref:GGDEF domain-containing protein n=1 Tax=Massilia sp. X63 TaxID=3237285 RepID=UPI0034DDC118
MPYQDPSFIRPTIHPWRAEFADAALEQRFLHHVMPERNAQLKASLLFAAFCYVLFGVTDIATLGLGPTAWMLLGLRAGVALVALAGHAAVSRHPRSARVSELAACSALVAALAVFMAVAWFQPSAMPWNTMSHALLLMVIYVIFPNRFVYALAMGIGSSIFFAAMLFSHFPLKTDDLLTLVLLLVCGNAIGYIAARRYHVAQREQFHATVLLQQLAERDALTGCYNRRVLQRGLLDAELAQARRKGTALSVILCDIDHFKRINDTHGHASGDVVLDKFAGLLKAMTRASIDSVIRYGGEEFLVVLPQTDLAGAQALAERIRAAFAASATPAVDGRAMLATASFGIATVPERTPHPPARYETLVDAADAQLYAVKRGGRNGVRATSVAA